MSSGTYRTSDTTPPQRRARRHRQAQDVDPSPARDAAARCHHVARRHRARLRNLKLVQSPAGKLTNVPRRVPRRCTGKFTQRRRVQAVDECLTGSVDHVRYAVPRFRNPPNHGIMKALLSGRAVVLSHGNIIARSHHEPVPNFDSQVSAPRSTPSLSYGAVTMGSNRFAADR